MDHLDLLIIFFPKKIIINSYQCSIRNCVFLTNFCKFDAAVSKTQSSTIRTSPFHKEMETKIYKIIPSNISCIRKPEHEISRSNLQLLILFIRKFFVYKTLLTIEEFQFIYTTTS